ncbi:LysR family transcriptional regulator [Roseibium sp. Sym1]|uniref:LysR family transcriptional regulator n=1 Tax=Roseibium sp. Sym1 TaxID=3016006 RepID=UPI0022B519BF|nr:LysR family transcriptional regulator [Roseibium sp. Sym1]
MTKEREILNLRHIRVFLEVARFGGISAAADTVSLSQPAITQAIAKLEATFQQGLFVRTSSGMFLTEAGELFRARADRALELVSQGCDLAVRKQSRNLPARKATFDQQITSTQLRALLAVEHSGNFTLAARHIGVSQPSLHRVSRDLEAVSGLRLFVKNQQGIDLTDAARVLAQFSKLAYAELKLAFEEVDATRGVDSAHLVVGSLPLARSFILPEAINDLTRERPSVQVTVVDGSYDDMLFGLRHGDIDFIIGALRDPVPIEDVEQTALFSDRLGIFARTGHPLANKRRVELTDLLSYPWAVPRFGTPTRRFFDALFEERGEQAPGRLVDSGSLVLMKGVLKGSDRLALISEHQMREDLANRQVVRIPFDVSHTARPIGITTRRNWKPTRTQQEFMALIREAVEKLV